MSFRFMCLTQQSVFNGHHLYRSILEGSLTLTLRKSLSCRVCHRRWKVKVCPKKDYFLCRDWYARSAYRTRFWLRRIFSAFRRLQYLCVIVITKCTLIGGLRKMYIHLALSRKHFHLLDAGRMHCTCRLSETKQVSVQRWPSCDRDLKLSGFNLFK